MQLSAGFCALVLEILLFMVVAAKCGWELIDTSPPQWALLLRRVRGRPPQDLRGELVPSEEGESGSGVGARRSVQGMVAVACIARAGIIAFMLVHGAWVPYLALPDLVYLATYGFLVVFLAQMQQIVVGNRYLWVKIATSASLAAVLVVSLVVCTVRWGTNPLSKRSVFLRKFLYYELGVTYLLMFVAFVYFGVRICVAAQTNKGLFRRSLLLTSVCGLALSTKGAFFVAAAANAWRADALFPNSSRRYCFEALIALEDLLPSIAILVLTARGRGRRYPIGSSSEAMGFGRYSNSPMFGNISSISPGPVTSSQFTYGSAINNHA